MADGSVLKSVSGQGQADYNDRVTLIYEVQYDSIPTNWYDALSRAQSATGTPVPARRTLYASGGLVNLYSGPYDGKSTNERRDTWHWSVTFIKPSPSQRSTFEFEDPLSRPARFDIRYLERDRVIDRAKNVEALSRGDGAGGNRAANTEGPIVNAAGIKPDEPQVDTERLEVLVIHKNFASLADIVSRNRTYKRTTNSDTVQGYAPRELRYLLTESLGETEENGVVYWPGATTILAEGTTDVVLDNVGYDYWDDATGEKHRAKVDDPDNPGTKILAADPINLKLNGDQGGTNATTITYRHLEPEPYASLFA